ncbi:MAG TPA: ATP-binding protein, partial [Chitinophagaceae bacterium]|nr:ATP-binding protein [Chitinophagaceae bacterium]
FWICTSGGGLNLFDRENKIFTHFQHQDDVNSISNSNVNSITEDRNKNLWIATIGGLNFFDKKTQQFTAYTMEDGLPGNNIFGILEDGEGNLWISTDKGLSCFNPSARTFKNFSTADGLQSDKFKEQAFCKSSADVMYFGGNNGFNQFNPGNIKTIPFEPPLVITGFQLFTKPVPVAADPNDSSPLKESITETKAITLSYKNSFISFGFASLNYSSPEKKHYAYMLEGFDKIWNEVGTSHTATYTNLDPGSYIFKVRGMNNEGKWSPAVTSIQLTITPPFWQTWWFRIAMLIVISGIIIASYLARMNAVKTRQKILEQKVKEQTIQLVQSNEEERKARLDATYANEELEKKNKELEQFVYIASHDLREPLRTTSGFIEVFQKQYKGKLDEKADTYLDYISQASARMKRLIDDLLDYSRINNEKEPEKVDCNNILQEVLSDLGTVISESGAAIKAGELPVISGHPTAIKQLFQNLLANAIKFRKKDTVPEIQIASEINDEAWKFSFADNGIGIAPRHREKIFAIFERLHSRKEYEGTGIGLAHCKKIVELHRGNIWVESIPGTGSTFYFTIYKNDIQ